MKMALIQNFGNVILMLGVFSSLFVKESRQTSKEYTLEDPRLCSPITKRKLKSEVLIVNQGHSISRHWVAWNIPNLCKFEVQSYYSKGGILAVIQKLNLRKNITSGECIDYIQFRAKKGSASQRHCGSLQANFAMNYYLLSKEDTDSISYTNSFIDPDGELDVVVYISKDPLSSTEKTEFTIVFTSYKECIEHYKNKHLTECDSENSRVCINSNYFGDGLINCPYYGCVDEGGCFGPPKSEPTGSIAKRVIIGSISTFAIVFGVFILLIWAFKRHKLFCWAADFAHPTLTPDNNRNSRILEMNEQTGARLAETQPSAPPVDEDKDLPPSYDSLFPDPR